MGNPLWVEIIGYTGSALVVLSLTRKSILKLRAFGLAASAVFFIYSMIIQAYPIAAVNVVVATVHIYFLLKLTRRPSEVFSTLRVYPESRYLERFLEFHASDIARFQPDFSYEPSSDLFATFVLRDMVPAGLLIARTEDGSSNVEVLLDYAIPQYRDFKLGRFLYSEASNVFDGGRFTTASAIATTPDHATYLQRLGFQKAGADRYTMDLTGKH